MGAKHLAAAAVAAAAVFSAAGAAAQELRTPMTQFYVSVPLGATTAKESMPAFGLKLQGSKPYQTVNIDSRMLGFGPLAAVEAKWIIAGVVAGGAALAISSRDKSTSTKLASQAQQQQANCPQPQACLPQQ